MRSAGDESVAGESGQVVAGLVDGVVLAQQRAHQGTQAPVGDSEGSQVPQARRSEAKPDWYLLLHKRSLCLPKPPHATTRPGALQGPGER